MCISAFVIKYNGADALPSASLKISGSANFEKANWWKRGNHSRHLANIAASPFTQSNWRHAKNISYKVTLL